MRRGSINCSRMSMLSKGNKAIKIGSSGSAPSNDTFINGVHNSSVGHDAHEMRAKTTV